MIQIFESSKCLFISPMVAGEVEKCKNESTLLPSWFRFSRKVGEPKRCRGRALHFGRPAAAEPSHSQHASARLGQPATSDRPAPHPSIAPPTRRRAITDSCPWSRAARAPRRQMRIARAKGSILRFVGDPLRPARKGCPFRGHPNAHMRFL